MFKKLLFIFLAGVILVTLLVEYASACQIRLRRYLCSDLVIDLCITGLKSEDVLTVMCQATYIGPPTSVEGWLTPSGQVVNADPEGIPFEGTTLETYVQDITTQDYDDKGNVCLEYTAVDWAADVGPVIADALGAVNPQWMPFHLHVGDIRTLLMTYQVNKKTGDMESEGGACITGKDEESAGDFEYTCAPGYVYNVLYIDGSVKDLSPCLEVPTADYNLESICNARVFELYNQ